MPALKRIGHKGADLIAPGNTLASFDAALAAGVDMVEFDVLPENPDRSGRLVLAHDFSAVARRDPLTLEEGLAHFAQDAWEGIELDVDLKTTGYEGRVDAIMSHWALVTPRLARVIEQAGGELYVWTVDDPTRIAELGAIGVTGIITNDPRLFATA